jgi:general secretion pathway protein G
MMTLKRRSRRRERGYTLLEVLIVLTIIALVAALVGPRMIAQLDRSKVTTAQVQLRSLMSAMETMRLDLGRYPGADEGLKLLVEPPLSEGEGWQGPYLEGELPKDPWGRDYAFAVAPDPLARPRIISYGADGREGGSGLNADIVYGGSPS